MARFRFLSFLIALLVSPLAMAERVQTSFSLKDSFVQSLLLHRVFTGPGSSLRFHDDGSGCQYVILRQPKVSAATGRFTTRAAAEIRAGHKVAGRCLLTVNWHGQLELIQEPRVGRDRRSVVLQMVSWRALKPDGNPDSLSNTVGHWFEQYLPASLKSAEVSFAAPISQLGEFLSLILSARDADQISRLTASLSIDSVAVENQRVRVVMGIDSPPSRVSVQRTEPSLTDAELAQLESHLDEVDAFFSYTIKALNRGQGQQDSAVLLDVLMELRRDLVAVLANRQHSEYDPARGLFIRAWDGLTPIFRSIAEQQPDYQSALEFLTFIGAGDALRALDQLGPAAGIEVSSDGLRRLARLLIPGATEDPLARDNVGAVDAELRRSLGFGEPLPLTMDYGETSWIDWLIPSAVAAGAIDAASVKRLNNWIPKTQEMNTYLPMVRDLLRAVVAEQLRSRGIPGAYQQPYRWLVFATAWQESCWRQFVAKDNMRVPMQSGSGDIGIMQINPKVWRGLYDLQGLRWDITYNARAGADILEHHMINYAIKNGEQQKSGGVDNLARSTYATYNGGPSQFSRYRSSGASARDKKVDALFYEKYRKLKGGAELGVAACYGN